jgi:uncharacterized phage-associated protein
MTPHTAREIASYILAHEEPGLNRWALQKLLYYCQAWTIAWDGKPLFDDAIEAWVDGPVCRDVWKADKEGQLAPCESLLPEAKRNVDAVLALYARRSGGWLRELTHREPPWADARRGLAPDQKGDEPITVEALRRYYGSLHVPPRDFPSSFLEALDTLVNTPPDVPPVGADREVDATSFLEWLRTGEGDPWAKSGG